ncbi:MAG: TolC family protein [Melioribacteraceae bacterium]
MKKAFITILLLLPAVNIFAQHSFKSVEEVWNYALKNNPQDTVYSLNIASAEKSSRTAHSYIFPKVSAGFSYQKNITIPETPVPGELFGKPGQTSYLQFGQKYNYSAGITVSKSLFDWYARFQYKITELNVSLRKAEKEYFEQTLKEQIAQVYYASLTSIEAVRIGHADLSVADTMLAIAGSRFSEGVIDSIVYNQAVINRNNNFEKLEKSKQYRTECLNSLKQLLGLNPVDAISLTENISIDIKINDSEKLLPNYRHTDLLRLKNDITGIEVKKARARFYPKIDIVHYYGSLQYQDEFKLKSSDWKPNQYTCISISIPIFTGFSNKAQYDAAVIEKEIAEKNYQDELRKSDISDDNLTAAYTSSKRIVDNSKESFRISKLNVQLAEQKYSQGIFALDDYLKVFDDYLKIENQFLNNVTEYLVNKATIEARSK